MNIIRKHLVSYAHALRGIRFAFRSERNMIIHLLGAIGVLILNFSFAVRQTEWLITILLIGVVWGAEIFNTAIEKLADHVSLEQHPLIGQAKDLAAGAVLVICIASAVCGMIIYRPYLINAIA